MLLSRLGFKQVCGAGKIFDKPSKDRFPMVKGLHVHAFAMNSQQITEYVDLTKVESKSIWGDKSLIGKRAYALSEIGFAPQACAFDTAEIVAQKSCIVFVPADECRHFPWDVYLNSRIPRFIFALVLRSALVEGNDDIWRSHINSNAVKRFPVPERLLDRESELSPLAKDLEKLAGKILNRWQAIDSRIKEGEKTSIALLPLRYVDVTDYRIFRTLPVKLEEEKGIARLQPFWRSQPTFDRIEGDPDALQVVKYMMDHPEFDLTPQPGAAVPRDFHGIAEAIKNADVSRSPEIIKFNQVLEVSEEIIANAFSLTKSESTYLRKRLETAPFAAMQPRWPWTPAAIRATRVYEANRFG